MIGIRPPQGGETPQEKLLREGRKNWEDNPEFYHTMGLKYQGNH